MLVDTLGLAVGINVHAADVQDRDGAAMLFESLPDELHQHLKKVWADGGYRGPKLAQAIANLGDWVLEIVKRNDDLSTFEVLPHRWIVERTFGWLTRWRRLAKDFEQLPQISRTILLISLSFIMLRKLCYSTTTL